MNTVTTNVVTARSNGVVHVEELPAQPRNRREASALEMLQNGITPVRLGTSGEFLKMPIEDGWQTAVVTPADVQRWFDQRPNSNIGARGGQNSIHPYLYLVRFDFDTDADAIFPAWRESIPFDVAITKTGKGFHIWFYSPYDVPNKLIAGRWEKGEDGKRRAVKFIEIKATGGYVVAPGSLHPGGHTYEWLHGDYATIPALTDEQVRTLFAAARKFDAGAGNPVILPGEKLPAMRRPAYNPPAYMDADDLRERIRRKFDSLAYAKAHMAYDVEKRQSQNRRTQLGGNGGFFVYDDDTWYCFAEGLGGDCYDLVGWLEYGPAWFSDKAGGFRDVLRLAGEFVGETIPESHPLLTGEKSASADIIDLLNPRTRDYWKVMNKLGYEFKMNSLLGRVEVNDKPISTIMEAELRNALFDYGLKNAKRMEDSWTQLAARNMYHPIREYLDTLVWDGEDHIKRFAALIHDEFGFFETALRRWMIGAISRAYNATPNVVMVWLGSQGVGKSRLARHICPDPIYHIETEMNPAKERDMHMRCVSRFVWEWPEAQHIFRNPSFIEPLKGILTNERLTIRQMWDKYDNDYPNLANHIATLNDDGLGFFADVTGNRRYLVSNLLNVDSRVYEYDISLLWATAVSAYRDGQGWKLTPEEEKRRDEINSLYLMETIVETLFNEQIEFIDNPDVCDYLQLTEILRILQDNGLGVANVQKHTDEIKRILKKHGIDANRKSYLRFPWSRSYRRVGWRGIVPKNRNLLLSLREDDLRAMFEFEKTGEIAD